MCDHHTEKRGLPVSQPCDVGSQQMVQHAIRHIDKLPDKCHHHGRQHTGGKEKHPEKIFRFNFRIQRHCKHDCKQILEHRRSQSKQEGVDHGLLKHLVMKRHIVIVESDPFKIQADPVKIRQTEKHTGYHRNDKKQNIDRQNRSKKQQVKIEVTVCQPFRFHDSTPSFLCNSIIVGKQRGKNSTFFCFRGIFSPGDFGVNCNFSAAAGCSGRIPADRPFYG
ncbi:unknown [Hungatella hathewayi CAG:224]|nr:unknown [Hungatella hathewayi CAG:224]